MKQSHKEKRPLKTDLRLCVRSAKELWRIEPKLPPLMAVSALAKAAPPLVNLFFTARILNELLGGKDPARLAWLVGWTIGLNLLLHLVSQGANRAKAVCYERLLHREEQEVSEAFLETDFENLENPEFQNHKRDYDGNRNMNGPMFGEWRFTGRMEALLQNSFSCCIAAALAVPLFFSPGSGLSSPLFSVLLLVAVAAVSVAAFLITKRQIHTTFHLNQKFLRLNRLFWYFMRISSDYHLAKDIRIFQEQDLLSQKGLEVTDEGQKIMSEIGRGNGRSTAAASILSVLLSGFVYLFVGLRAIAGAFGIGMVVQYVGAITQFTQSFVELINTGAFLRETLMYMEYYFDIIDGKKTRHTGTLPVEKRDDGDYLIEFHDVSFRYPGTEAYALRHLSLALHVGKKLAVVGKNGSGKTTFIKLLCRLYDPTEGIITMNGIDIRKYDYKDYLSIFSVVFQDFRLFAFPLSQNVAASTEVDKKRARECLERAGFGEQLAKLPKGLDTPLYKNFEEDGVEVSGGEAQKIALARALYKNAPFVVLDEPTAALDPVSEYEIYSHFNELVEGKSAVYISHRLSSCRFCDDIAVFSEGQLVQRGNHDALLGAADGLYARLWTAQAQYYQEESEREKVADLL